MRISGKSGRILEWIEDYGEIHKAHRHTSHRFGLSPGSTITPDQPELLDAARKVLEGRGGFTVDFALANGELTEVAVQSTLGNPCKIRHCEKAVNRQIGKGQTFKLNANLEES